MTSNPQWDWGAVHYVTQYPGVTDPRFEREPPAMGYMPEVSSTPPPPDVWMAGAGHDDKLRQLMRALQLLRVGT